MKKQYLSAPLPSVGQKRMFAREFIKVLKQYPEDTVFVDLFGGSGLLSRGSDARREPPVVCDGSATVFRSPFFCRSSAWRRAGFAA